MVFKVNYNHQRAERTRLKQAKKDAKVREREEAAARRKSEPGSDQEPGAEPDAEEDAVQPPPVTQAGA